MLEGAILVDQEVQMVRNGGLWLTEKFSKQGIS